MTCARVVGTRSAGTWYRIASARSRFAPARPLVLRRALLDRRGPAPHPGGARPNPTGRLTGVPMIPRRRLALPMVLLALGGALAPAPFADSEFWLTDPDGQA